MCGIIGYVGPRACEAILLRGLRRLEYRGYDSAGLALQRNDGVECIRAVGNLSALEKALRERAPLGGGAATLVEEATVGIGHTRWATHGAVTHENAHPHSDAQGRVHIVLNGIVENHVQLRRELGELGAQMASDTDAEVVAHLIAAHYDGDLAVAVDRARRALSGHFAFVALSADEPGVLVGTRHECPLVVGCGDGEQLVASAAVAFGDRTRDVHVVGEGEVVVMTEEGVTTLGAGRAAVRPVRVDWSEESIDKGSFETFMRKEIAEQGAAVARTLDAWPGAIDTSLLRGVGRITIVGCGTSYHAGLAGRAALERWARVPCTVEIASEFRCSDPLLDADGLVIGITQSGETADTLAAMRLARERGARVIALTNVAGSQAVREADGALMTHAGIEIGVAATKTFVAQVAALYSFALALAELRGTLDAPALEDLRAEMRRLPAAIDALSVGVEPTVAALAARLADCPFFLFLGRLSGLPVALEGALKLKEISYVPTDAYAAGEMKHGPIALLGPETPVVALANDPAVLGKMLSNVSEVRARGARVFAIATEGSKEVAEHAEEVVYVPAADPLLQVLLSIVPLQLFAYHVARARGLNVDQPRNLAKTVTVE